MKFQILTALFLMTAFVGAAINGCGRILPPTLPPATPTQVPTSTPTATITPGCQTSGLIPLTGVGSLSGTMAISLTPGITVTPTWSYSGQIPPHTPGVTLIQTAAQWNSYVASSYVPAGIFPIPFNPATQSLIVIAYGGYCPNTYTFSSVCNNATQFTVQINAQQNCCPIAPVNGLMTVASFQALIVDNFALPIVVNQTYFPYTGPPCY